MNAPATQDASRGRSPNRPSFLAPTKASLARSHPEILERALSRSPTRRPSQDARQSRAETRAFGLRDRKALRPSLTMIGSPVETLKRDMQSPLSRRSSGLSAFAAPPRRVSKRISASDFQFESPAAIRVNKVVASVTNTPDDQLASELGSAADPIGDFDQPSLHEEFEEPDLPPTPTQLGLERPPGRPKGLLSSSPSMRRENWAKRRAACELEQSPSKLRTVDYGVDERLIGLSSTTEDTLLPEPVQKKRKLKMDLSAELESLKQDVAELENLSEKLDRNDDSVEYHLNNLISVLKSASTKPRPAEPTISSLISTLLPFATKCPPRARDEPLPTNPFVLDKSAQTEPYLSIFAPLRLSASSSVVPSAKSGPVLEKHKLTLSAPPPFPPEHYAISIEYEANPETQCLLSISEPSRSDPDAKIPEYLRQWISTRLRNPLLKLDVSGLCWGINRYWEALLSRAQIWAQIEGQHAELTAGNTGTGNSRGSKKSTSEQKASVLTISDLQRVIPHLERTSMLFESRDKSLKMMVTCELTLDEWTGEPGLTPSICVSATGDNEISAGNNVERESKKLFQAILSKNEDTPASVTGGADPTAIIKAIECTVSAVFGAGSES